MADKQVAADMMDRRLLERQVRLSGLKYAKVQAMLDELPDIADRGVVIPVDTLLAEAVAATAARRARALEEKVEHRLPMAARNEDEHYDDDLDELNYEDDDEDDD
jgi:hypothetical protein